VPARQDSSSSSDASTSHIAGDALATTRKRKCCVQDRRPMIARTPNLDATYFSGAFSRGAIKNLRAWTDSAQY
jgi:hypothetical protein